jgi:hypothetical protein
MLQTSFPKMKKHHPTNLYMLYPMAQSIAYVCVEIDKQMPPQGGIVHCHHPSSTIQKQNHFGARARSYQNLNVSRLCSPRVEICVTFDK